MYPVKEVFPLLKNKIISKLPSFRNCPTPKWQQAERQKFHVEPTHKLLLTSKLNHVLLASKILSESSTCSKNLMQIRHFTTNNGSRNSSKLRKLVMGFICAGLVSGAGYHLLQGNIEFEELFVAQSATRVVQIDYRKVYDAIEAILHDSSYDDGSYGPVFIRLAWHSSGSYDKITNTGGSSKATMRFEPESTYHANQGLEIARKRLEIVKKQFPYISYGDLWTLAAVCAIQEMGGPIIPWRPGRIDGGPQDCPPDGRLPDGGNPSPQHPRDIFYRMGFNDQEIACLVGCHGVGRCHNERSGFDGPWTFSPTSFSNQFFVQLYNNNWTVKPGTSQFQDPTGELMMMPADMTFKSDPTFRKWVEIYAKDEKRFYCDFVKAFTKLIELGVEFPEGTKTHKFKRTLF